MGAGEGRRLADEPVPAGVAAAVPLAALRLPTAASAADRVGVVSCQPGRTAAKGVAYALMMVL